MEKKSNFEKWLDLTQTYIQACHKTFAKKFGLIDPDKKNEFAAQTDFESCNELTFEGVVAWIQQNMSKVEGSTAAVIRKENLDKSTEDFAYKVEIFFMKDNQVLTSALRKVVLCNSLENDLAMNFKEVNGQHVFIIK
jgi:hypothetical protein